MAHDGMTIMLVTHEIGFARRVADCVVLMHEGKIWEQGPAAETLAGPRPRSCKRFSAPCCTSAAVEGFRRRRKLVKIAEVFGD
jgi:ABC-type polar amino acid transport system ATPase subunit